MFDLLMGQGARGVGSIEPNAQRGIGGLGLFKCWQMTRTVDNFKPSPANELGQ
jgi:hypothetical protein